MKIIILSTVLTFTVYLVANVKNWYHASYMFPLHLYICKYICTITYTNQYEFLLLLSVLQSPLSSFGNTILIIEDLWNCKLGYEENNKMDACC